MRAARVRRPRGAGPNVRTEKCLANGGTGELATVGPGLSNVNILIWREIDPVTVTKRR